MRLSYRGPLAAVLLWAALFASCGSPAKQDSDIPVTTSSEKARAAFLEGRTALEAGRTDQARALFDSAIEADPTFALALLYRARTATSAIEWKSYVDKAISNKGSASSGEKIMIDMLSAMLNDDTEGKLELAQQLVKEYPKSARALHELADAHADMKHIDEERTTLESAIALDPSWAMPHRSLAESFTFMEPRFLAKAEEHAMKYVELQPKEAVAQITLGDVYRAQIDLEKARDAYARAADLDPESSVALSKKGHAETYLGNYEAARTDFEAAAAQTDTRKVGPKNFAANTWLYAGNVKAALKAIEDVIAAVPSLIPDATLQQQALVVCQESRCRIATEAGASDVAADAFTKHAELARAISGAMNNPAFSKMTEAELALLEGYMMAKKGDYAAAAVFADRAEEQLKDMNNPRAMDGVHFLRGFIAYLSGKHQDAIKHFASAGDDRIEVKFYAAMAHEAMGEKEQAARMFKEVTDWNFNDLNYALIRSKAVAKLKT